MGIKIGRLVEVAIPASQIRNPKLQIVGAVYDRPLFWWTEYSKTVGHRPPLQVSIRNFGFQDLNGLVLPLNETPVLL
jgi:hypothetical protein